MPQIPGYIYNIPECCIKVDEMQFEEFSILFTEEPKLLLIRHKREILNYIPNLIIFRM